MLKRIIIFIGVIITSFLLGYFSQTSILNSSGLELSYSLLNMYLFHFTSSLIVYLIIEGVSWKMPDQAGYAFLASVFLKLGFFSIIFMDSIFSEIELEKIERLNIIIPLFLFLIIEAVFSARLLNSK